MAGLTQATIKQGVAQFFFSQKSEAVKKLLDAQIKQQVQLRKLGNPFAAAGVEEYTPGLFSKNKFEREIAGAASGVKNINQLSQGLEDLFASIFDDKNKKKASKDILTIAEVLKELQAELTSLNATELNLKTDETESKIKATEKAIDDLIKKVGLNPSNPLVLKLFADIQDLQLPLLQKMIRDSARKERLSLPLEPEFVTNQKLVDSIQDQISKAAGKREISAAIPIALKLGEDNQALGGIPSGIDLEIKRMVDKLKSLGITKSLQDGINVAVSALRFPELNALYSSMVTAVGQFGNKTKDIVQNTINSAFVGVGESIGQAIAGGGDLAKIAFGGLLKTISGGLKAIGQAMIELGTAKIIIEKFKFAPGITTLLAGIATVAAASVLEKSLPGFATGVNNFSGGFAKVGERGPELVRLPKGSDVIPNGQLNSMQAGTQRVEVYGRIAGKDIYFSNMRSGQTINRNG